MKYTLALLIILLAGTAGFGQTKKMIEKANEKVEELNQWIVSVNPELALTDDQKEEVRQLHVQKLIDIKAINKSDLSDEAKKEERQKIYKKVGKTIHNDVLTKEQRKAKKIGKEKQEEKE
jgi:hypothetical protein